MFDQMTNDDNIFNPLKSNKLIVNNNSNNNSNKNSNNSNNSNNDNCCRDYNENIKDANFQYQFYISTNGNDNTGNGTVENPYNSICKIAPIIEQLNRSEIISIAIFIDQGDYQENYCTLNLVNKTVYLVNNGSSVDNIANTDSNNNSTNIYNLNIFSLQSNFVLYNINLYFNINNNNSNNNNSSFQLEFINSLLVSNNDSTININSVDNNNSNSCNVQNNNDNNNNNNITIYSSIIVEILFNINSSLIMNIENSKFHGTNINAMSNQIINYNNSSLNNALVYFKSGQCTQVIINNCSLLYNYSNNLQVFLLFQGNQLNISNTVMESTGEFFESMIHSYGAKVFIFNTTFSNWNILSSFINIESNSQVLINNITAISKLSTPVFIEISNSNLNASTLNIEGNDIIMILVSGPSNVNIKLLKLKYQNQHGSPLMVPREYLYNERSNITITESTFENIDSFSLLNSNLIIDSIIIENSNNLENLFYVKNSYIFISKSKFGSYSLLGLSYLFNLNSDSKLYLNNTIVSNSSLLIYSSNSTSTISNCTFQDLFSRDTAINLINSILSVDEIIIQSVYTIGNSFLSSSESTISISNSKFVSLSVGLHAFAQITNNSQVSIENSWLTDSFFQNQIFFLSESQLFFNSSITMGNNVYGNEAFRIESQSILLILNTTMKSNMMNTVIGASDSNINIEEGSFNNNSGVFLDTFNCQIKLYSLSFSKNPASALLFLIYFSNSQAYINELTIDSNYFMGSVIEVYQSTVNFNQFIFTNNQNVDNILQVDRKPSSLSFYASRISISRSVISSNFQWTSSLIQLDNCQISISDSNLSKNSIPFSGYVISAKNTTLDFISVIIRSTVSTQGTIEISNSSFSIRNSSFINNNIQGNGGALFIDHSILGVLSYNIFRGNIANIGGAIFTSGLILPINNTKTLNTFEDNSSIYGDDIASNPSSIQVQYPPYVLSTSNSVFLVDDYSNLVSDDIYVGNLTIVQASYEVFLITNITLYFKGGASFFNYSFNIHIGSFNVSINIDQLDLRYSYLKKPPAYCNDFQIMEDYGCKYCSTKEAYSPSVGRCLKCDTTEMVCVDSEVFTKENYFMVGKDVNYVYECPPGLCGSTNTCPSPLYVIGDNSPLCSRCINDFDDPTTTNFPPGSSLGLSVSKNSIHCCTYFIPTLIIPYAIFVISFALLLSIFKYSFPSTVIGNIIIYFQTMSILFFPYEGLYFIPLFRFSIDYIDAICLYKLNYFEKVTISTASILFIYIVGLSNISAKIIFILLKMSPKLSNRLPKTIIKNLKRHLYYSKGKGVENDLRNAWNLYLIILQPLLFNLLSVVIPKSIANQYLLSIDLTVPFLDSPLQIVFFSVSIVVLFLVSFLLPLVMGYTIFYKIIFKSKKGVFFSTTLYKVFRNTRQYRKGFKWWALIVIIKNILFTSLSISLLYSSSQFLSITIAIQILYSFAQFMLYPQKTSLSYHLENITNVSQLSALIILKSSVTKLLSNFYYGIIITSISFLTFIIIIFYKIIIFKRNNNQINNNSNNKIKTK